MRQFHGPAAVCRRYGHGGTIENRCSERRQFFPDGIAVPDIRILEADHLSALRTGIYHDGGYRLALGEEPNSEDLEVPGWFRGQTKAELKFMDEGYADTGFRLAMDRPTWLNYYRYRKRPPRLRVTANASTFTSEKAERLPSISREIQSGNTT